MATDCRTRTVDGDGVRLAVREWGDPSAPCVVLVHGYPDTSAVWIPVAEALVDHGFHVVAYDVRGAGASDTPPSLDGYELSHLVEDLRRVVDAVSPDAPVHLVGHDWGSLQGWEAACSDRMRGRMASYTSISGPSLDFVGQWFRARLKARNGITLARQVLRSMYVGVFHVPGVARGAERFQRVTARSRKLWSRSLARKENARVDAEWPAPTFGADIAHGMNLYRANVRPRLRHPSTKRAHVPVQLVVPVRDPFVPPSFLVGIEELAPGMERRHVDAGHWVVRSQPVDVAVWIASFIESLGEQAAKEVS